MLASYSCLARPRVERTTETIAGSYHLTLGRVSCKAPWRLRLLAEGSTNNAMHCRLAQQDDVRTLHFRGDICVRGASC